MRVYVLSVGYMEGHEVLDVLTRERAIEIFGLPEVILADEAGTEGVSIRHGNANEMTSLALDLPSLDRVLLIAALALERVQVDDAGEAEMLLEKVVTLDARYIPPKP